MNKHRKEIEKIKEKLFADIVQNSMKYKYAIIKKFQSEFNKIDDFTDKNAVKNFERNILNKFSLSKNDKAIFTKTLEEAQNKIAEVWNDYYSGEEEKENRKGTKTQSIIVSEYDKEKMTAAYSVNFDAIESKIKEKMIREFRQMIKGEYGFNALRKKLINSGLGFKEAFAEANTALAQFDNGYNTQMAHEAGIEKFIYDGPVSENTRPFCREHVGKVYTIEELKAMDNGQGLPVETSLGGYNCTHFLTPYFEGNK